MSNTNKYNKWNDYNGRGRWQYRGKGGYRGRGRGYWKKNNYGNSRFSFYLFILVFLQDILYYTCKT